MRCFFPPVYHTNGDTISVALHSIYTKLLEEFCSIGPHPLVLQPTSCDTVDVLGERFWVEEATPQLAAAETKSMSVHAFSNGGRSLPTVSRLGIHPSEPACAENTILFPHGSNKLDTVSDVIS